jgi:hypothetical protein
VPGLDGPASSGTRDLSTTTDEGGLGTGGAIGLVALGVVAAAGLGFAARRLGSHG